MEIILQKNTSEANRFSKNISNVGTMSATLKDTTSITDPTLIVTGSLDVKSCNYLTIPVFGRQYFIMEVRSIRANVWEIDCHVDVLSSFKDSILSNEAIIKKQEYNWNLYLDDGSFRVYQNPLVLTKEFPSGFNTTEFVLAIAGH